MKKKNKKKGKKNERKTKKKGYEKKKYFITLRDVSSKSYLLLQSIHKTV